MILLPALALLLTSSTAPTSCGFPPYPVGTRTHTYIDAARANRPVNVLLRYPAQTPGGPDAPALLGCTNLAPVISFGHGFVIPHTSYDYLAPWVARSGFVVVLPGTESGLSPSHEAFALDLIFAAKAVQSDPFFDGAASSLRGYGGHSMGGGAALLAAAKDRNAGVLILLAPAETNPSSIAAAARVRATTFFEVASRDCITPRASTAQLMFDAINLTSKQKFIDEIGGGSHCQFAAANVPCRLAEQSCGGQPTVPESIQQNETRIDVVEFLFAWGFSGDNVFVDDFE